MPSADDLNPPALLTKDHDRYCSTVVYRCSTSISKNMLYKIRRSTRRGPMLQPAVIELMVITRLPTVRYRSNKLRKA